MDNSTTPSTGPAPTGPANAGGPTASEASTTTTTITQQREGESDDVEVLPLTLHARASVTWDENVIDNEGLGRKKSKRCCIFHKQRPFGESSTDSSDYDSDGSSSSSSGGPSSSRNGGRRSGKKKGGGEKKIARPKQKGRVPDYQRFHA